MKFLFWFAYVSVPVTLLCGLLYLVVQQDMRTSANDPQIQLAEDAAAQIISGKQIDQVVPVGKVDIATSLASYLMVFNNQGVPLLSQAVLNGETPTLPQGVFNLTQAYHTVTTPMGIESRFTWQPAPGVRSAVVLLHFSSKNGIGYVLAGRSLREVEMREQKLSSYVVMCWLLTEALLFLMTITVYLLAKRGRFA